MEKTEINMEISKSTQVFHIENNPIFDNYVNDLNLQVHYSGYARLTPRWRGSDIIVPFCKLYLVESGEGILQAAGETVVLQPDTAYLVPPELSVSFSCPSSLQKLYFHLSLLKPDHYDLFHRLGRIAHLPLTPERIAELTALYTESSYYSCLRLKQHLFGILLDIYKAYTPLLSNIPAYSPHVMDTIHFIHQNLSAQLSVAKLAELRSISPTTLNKLFRKELGVTVSRYIDDQLLQEARSRLCHTELSISMVSDSLGFSDQFYFSKKFKAGCGLSPLQYRKKYRQHIDIRKIHE